MTADSLWKMALLSHAQNYLLALQVVAVADEKYLGLFLQSLTWSDLLGSLQSLAFW